MTIFAGNGHGSGFAIGENLILTNHHVIGESDKVVVKLGAGFEISGDVIAYNSAYDVAVIKVQRVYRVISNYSILPSIGTDVYALGSPLSENLDATLSRGVVSNVRKRR